MHDIVIVGCGMAGITAGLRASELGCSVAVLEKSPKEDRGGHTRFTESFRVPSADTDLEEYGHEFDVPDYTPEEFYDDIMEQTNGYADDERARTLVENAGETIEWLTSKGVEWEMEPPATGYASGRTWFDGEDIVADFTEQIESNGSDVIYDAEARALRQYSERRITGITVHVDDGRRTLDCDAVILASGGYSSSAEKRAAYLGPGYDDMIVRGSRHNTGEAIEMALDAGANAVGQWSGAHMALIDAASPRVEGGANRVDGYQYGVILNVNGERFLDEGEDVRTHTYAKFGREIFEQPRHIAHIVLDEKTRDLIRATGPSEPEVAETLPKLFETLDVDKETALRTVEKYNDACSPDEFRPRELDGNRANLRPPKSNWALPIDSPPFYAYTVTGGITFTFGGVEITPEAEVVDSRSRVIPGFYAAGNCTGGLFYHNYPGATALTNAAVYGKIAAERATEYIHQ